MSIPRINLQSIVQRDPEIIAAEVDQDLIMVSMVKGSYYGISDVARVIWEAIEQSKKVSNLIDDLVSAYDVDRSKCEEDTLSFLSDLLTERLVQVRDEPAA